MKRNLLTIVIGAVLVVVFAMLLFVFQVRQSEVVVVSTFLKPTATYTNAGAYLKLPWPIQKVNRFDQRVQNFEDKFSQNLTADSNPLLTSVYVGWRISDAQVFFPKFYSGGVPAAQRMLEGMLRSAKSARIGKHPLADFVNADPAQLKFDEIEKEIEQTVQAELRTNNCGIEIEFLGFKQIGLPESVTQTVFDRMKAERQVLISTAENEGKAQASIIESAADRQAANTVANAEAEAIHIKSEGEAAAAGVLPVFEKNPQLENFLLRIDALKSSLNQRATLIFDERTPPFDLFQHLPTNSPSH